MMGVENLPIYNSIDASTVAHTYFSQCLPNPYFWSWPNEKTSNSFSGDVLATENLDFITTEDGNDIAIEFSTAVLGTENSDFITTEDLNYIRME